MNNIFSSVKVYYFSGTGNSRKIAICFEEQCRKLNIDAASMPIESCKDKVRTPEENSLCGFVFPIHGFLTVWKMLKFILFFPRAQNKSSVFLINTSAGTKIGPLVLPGYEATGLWLPALILLFKGYSLAGALPLRFTPAQWSALFPAYKPQNALKLMVKSETTVSIFADKILSGRKALKGIIIAVISIPVLPLSVAYVFCGRFWLSKMLYADTRCISCGLCIKKCPVGAISLKNNKPFWSLSCESCMRCMSICPVKAVQSNIWLIAGAFALLLPIYDQLNNLIPAHIISGAHLRMIFFSLAALSIDLLAVVTAYRFLHCLMQFRPFGKAAEYLSISRYWRKYIEPSTTAKDFFSRDEKNQN